MFKINIYLKFVAIVVGLLGGTALSFIWGFWYGFPFILIGLVALVSYFLLGTVQSAAEFMQVQDIEGCETRLNLTFFPRLLFSANRAYFYMLKGTIAQQRGDKLGAEKYLKGAQEIKMPSDNERAMLEMQMLSISAQRNNMTQVKNHLRNLKKYNVTDESLAEQIRQVERDMKMYSQSRGQAMGADKSQMRQSGGGGKRRRPKMR